MTFDVHAHVVVPEITREAGNGEAWRPHVFRDEAGAQVVEMGGKPIRAAIAEFVDIDGILAAQDKADVDRLLLCPWVPLLYYDADPDESLVRARIQNDALAQLVRDHPERVSSCTRPRAGSTRRRSRTTTSGTPWRTRSRPRPRGRTWSWPA